ncbi:MAG TPA: patatin-like protein, partial [Coleofasciculaceae cyanobacterium]
SDIIVDVISGTSAGGINGILLSYALTNSTQDQVFDFKNFADVWRESGNIGQLLRQASASEPSPPSNPPQRGETVDSVLNGEQYYQDQLTNAFQTVWRNKAPASAGEWFSPSSELDLFITGTDLLGKVYKAFDNTGNLIEVKDHRTVFHLKYRQDRKQPFKPDETQLPQKALAKLCRITSCFPVAFPVVTVKLKADPQKDSASIQRDPNYPDYAIDQQLVAWGQLENRELPLDSQTSRGYQLHFVDGGVLDNRPFSYTINEIYHRTAYRPVTRKMFYIDPSPDQFLDSPKFRRMDKPSIWQAATDSLVGMPRYESIANDLKEINDRNEKVRRYKFLRATAERAVEENATIQADANAQTVYLRCRLVGLRDRILPLILKMDQVANPSNQDKTKLLEKAAQLLTQYIVNKKDRDAREDFLNGLSNEIRNLDVNYALRKHFFFLEKVCEYLDHPQDKEERQKLAYLAGNIGLQVQLLEVIQAGLEYSLQLEPIRETFYELIRQAQQHQEAGGRIYEYLLRLHRFLLDKDLAGDGLSSPQPEADTSPDRIADHFFDTFNPAVCSSSQRTNLLNTLLEKANRLTGVLSADPSSFLWNNDRYKFVPDSENASPTYYSLLKRVEEASEQLIISSQHAESDKLLALFKQFRAIDQAVYSFEYLSDIQAKEQLEIVRISPNDANKGFGYGKGLEDKLAGDQLGAFGGFFKKSWRSNDILWGRLDGVNRIVDALLTPEALSHFPAFLKRQIEFLENQTDSHPISPADYLADLLQETLPHATKAEQQTLLQTLLQLVDSATPPTQQTLEKISATLQELLVMAEHRAIVRAELGNVLEDAIDEQLEWNQQQIQPKQPDKILADLRYQPAVIQNLSDDRLYAINQLNLLIKSLVDPQLLAGVAGLLVVPSSHLDKVEKAIPLTPEQQEGVQGKEARKAAGQAVDQQRYLQYLVQTAFPHVSESTRRKLSVYPLSIAQASAATVPAIDDLYGFLNQLLKVTEQELSYPHLNKDLRAAIQDINRKIQPLIAQLQPTYQPVAGYFDRAITPFAAKELARASTQALLKDHQEEDYFRNKYRIGSENIADAIPPLVLQNLAARSGLILRNVLITSTWGDRVRPTWVYQFLNTLLKLFYWSVEARNSRISRFDQASPFYSILELGFLIAVATLTVFTISKIPYWLMVVLLSIPALWLIYTIRRLFTKI